MRCPSYRNYNILLDNFSKVCQYLCKRQEDSEPIPNAVEEPTLLKEIIDVYTSVHGYSISDLSQLLALYEHEFRSEYLNSNRTLHIIGGTNAS